MKTARSAHVFSVALIALAAIGCASPQASIAEAQETQAAAPSQAFTVASPDGRIKVEVAARGGQPVYSVERDGKTIVGVSKLGLRFAEGADLDRGFSAVPASRVAVDTEWQQPWGERSSVRDRHEEISVRFVSTSGPERAFTLRVRVFDEGVAFRYEVPDRGERALVDEITEFAVDPDAMSWWTPAGEFNRYEYIYKTTPVRDIYRVHTPFTLKMDSGETTGPYLAIHEAALVDYAGMWLDQRRAGMLEAELAPRHDGVKVRISGAFNTPWRVIQIADTAAGLVNGSDIYLNLNEPNALGDVSYFKPGKYVGIWWGMHINKYTWGSGPKHGATTENTRQYIDFAAENGFSGVLVEGWNIGWDGDWFSNGDLFRFAEPYPDFDIEALSDYAASRGVELIGHHETSANIANYEAQLDAAFQLYRDNGYSTVKTGYVADASDLVFHDEAGVRRYGWHDGQERVVHDLKVLKRAHDHGLAINAHEPVKDTGLRRTYPNAVSREGARGMEFNAWGTPPNPPEHTAILPFTRLLAGPMDFTPGIFDLMPNGEDAENRVQTTLAKQLALYVVIYSPVQMAADLPENYEARPDAFQFIKDVPADWETSIALDGEVGDFVVQARKERNSDDWYLGALTDEDARIVTVPLDFLEAGRTYRAQIYRDGPDADWQSNPYSIVIEQKDVTSADTLTLPLATSGGAAIRFSASTADTASARSAGQIVQLTDVTSGHVAPRNVTVWLPPGYDASDERYPVLYMHDGQNLFEPGHAYGGKEWQVDEMMSTLIADGKIRPAIVVGVWNTDRRWQEYAPEAFVDALPATRRDAMTEAAGGAPVSDDYLAFLVDELKPMIDARFRTLPRADDTLIAGSSMGGLISLYAASEYPETFGAAACVSTHWPLYDPSASDPETVIPAIKASLDAGGLDASIQRLWFDHGTINLDSHYAHYQEAMDAYLKALGFNAGNFESHVYPGADHNEASWANRLDDILVFLLGKG